MADTRHQNDYGGGGGGGSGGGVDTMPPTGESSSGIIQESNTLRWEGHRTQGVNIALGLRFDDTVRTLERRGDDRQSKEVLLQLATELRQFNDALAARLLRMSAVNRTLVEVLQKSEDGKAALMMRKAAELLVKGLANAEEEIHSLKATIEEVNAQRDHYKGLLAKTNSELDTSLAYAQVSKAIGERAGVAEASAAAAAAAAAAAPSSAAASSAEDGPTRRRSANRVGGKRGGDGGGGPSKGKGKAPARQPRQECEAPSGAEPAIPVSTSAAGVNGGGGSGSNAVAGTDPPIIADAAAAFRAAFMAAGVEVAGGEGEERGRTPPEASPEAASRKRRRVDAAAPGVAEGGGRGGGGGGDGEGELRGPREGDGRDHDDGSFGDNDGDVDDDNAGGEEGDGGRRRRRRGEDERRETGGGSNASSRTRAGERVTTGVGGSRKQRGVEVTPVTTVDDEWTEPLRGGGGSGGGGGGGSGVLHAEVDGGGDDGDAQGDDPLNAYDSDDAPSMFF